MSNGSAAGHAAKRDKPADGKKNRSMDSDLFSILSIGLMLIGAVLSFAYPKSDARYSRAMGVFALGAAMVLVDWFLDNPDRIAEVQGEIAVALVAFLLIFIRRLR
jgi:hypothetical protein